MKFKALLHKIFLPGNTGKNEKSWKADSFVFEELTRKISELEAQNQKLKDKNKALLILLDNASRKLSSYSLPANRQGEGGLLA